MHEIWLNILPHIEHYRKGNLAGTNTPGGAPAVAAGTPTLAHERAERHSLVAFLHRARPEAEKARRGDNRAGLGRSAGTVI